MRAPACRHEQQVLEAASDGCWSPALAAHIAECTDCADLALVVGWMQTTEEPSDPAFDPAQAGRIWRVADGEKRREQAARALLPVRVGELTACLFGAVALIGFAVRHAASLVPVADAVGARLLGEPVVASLGAVTVALLVGVSFFSLVLALGFGVARS